MGDGNLVSHRQSMMHTASTAASYLGVSESTVRKWARDGKLAHETTKGGIRIFREEDLRAVRESQSHE